jgi:hypothetical protein
MFLFSARVGALVPRVGGRFLMCAGAALAGTGFAAFAWLSSLPTSLNGYVLSVLPPVLLLGCGLTLAVAPLTNAVMSSVPPSETGIASAVNNAISRLAALLAVSVLALVLAHGFVTTLKTQLAHSTLPVQTQQRMWANRARLHDIPLPPRLTRGQRDQASWLLDQSFLAGFRSVMLVCAFSAWAGGITVLLLLPRSRSL